MMNATNIEHSLSTMKNTNLKYGKPDSKLQREQFCRRLLPVLIAGCFACGPAFANPTGGQVVVGQATITNNGNVLTIKNTPGAVIDWLSFSINSGQITQFLQQSSSSSVLNRIIGQNPSQIFGALESNGRVFLINPNGILFAPGSQVNVGGLVASSLDLSNTDFSSGKNNFNSSVQNPGSVVNQGSITTPSGGSIYLIAPQVQNSGILTSPQGDVLLAAGHSVQLMDGADPNIQVVISAPTDQAMNLGSVIAQGGKIGVLGALVNQSGTVSANSAVVGQNGEIVFKSSQTTMLSGNSQTTAIGTGNNSGGTIALLGPDVGIVDNAVVNASGQNGGGKVMVGGDFHGTNPAIEDATAVYIGTDASIKADAIQHGTGGSVAVWSDNATRMYGTISAQGGAQGGNGGYVETSSKNYLDFEGLVNVKAPQGIAGTLLLDPYDIIIDTSTSPYTGNITCSGCPSDGNTVTFTNVGPATPSHINNAYIGSQLANGDVVVSTLAAGGYIAVNAALNWSSGHMLTLAANGNISINASINGYQNGGKLALNSSGGTIAETAGAYIEVGQLSASSGTGSVALNSSLNSATSLAGTAGAGGFQFTADGALVVGVANGVTGITSTGPVTLTGSTITTNAATITAPALTLIADQGIGTQAVPLSTSVGSITATNGNGSGGGDIVISNTGQPLTIAGITQNVSPNPGSIYVISDNAVTVSGAIANNNGNPASNIGINAANGIAINAAVSAPGNTVALTTSAGNITESAAGSITASSLSAYATAGYVALTSANNAIGTVSGYGATGFALTDSVALNVGYVGSVGTYGTAAFIPTPSSPGIFSNTGGNIGLQSATSISISAPLSTSGLIALGAGSGNITQSASINAGSLSANAGGSVTLTNNLNSVGIVAGSSGTGSFAFSDENNFSVGYVPAVAGVLAQNGINAATQAVSLSSNGSISTAYGSAITATSLTLAAVRGIGSQASPLSTSVGTITATNGGGSGGGDIVISNTGQPLTIAGITQLASQTAGGIYVISDNAVTVSGAIVNIEQPGGNVGINAASGIAINAPVTGYAVGLTSTTGNITQASGANISTGMLIANAAAGSISLTSPGNVVGTVSASTSGDFALTDSLAINVAAGLPVGSSGTPAYIAAPTPGINSASGNIGLQSAGAISIASPLTAAGTVALGAAGGDITQSAAISSTSLSANSSGSVALTQTNNGVTGNVAGTSGTGSFNFYDGAGFNIGSVDGVGSVIAQNGINAAGQAVNLISSGAIGANGGVITGSALTINTATGIGSQSAPLLTSVGTLYATNSLSGDIAISNSGVPLTVTGAAQSVTGNIFINSGTQSLTTSGAISTPLGDVGLMSGGDLVLGASLSASGTVALQSTGGAITQTAGAITSTNLSAVGSTGVTLNDAANSVATVAGDPAVGGAFIFTDSTGFTIGTVPLVGPNYSGGFFIPALSGISANGFTELNALNGDITVNALINAGASYVELDAVSGSIMQGANGAITTSAGLILDAAANIGASGAGNAIVSNVGTLQVSQANNVYVNNTGTGNLNVGQIAGTGIVNVSTAGALTVPAGSGGTDFTGASITLVSAGNMSLGANNTFTAAGGSGPIALYAGFTQAPGSAPLPNLSSATLTQAGTLNGTAIGLWANSYSDFSGTATYSTIPTYSPGPAPIDIYVTGTTVTDKTYDGTTVAILTGGTLVGIPSYDLSGITSFTQGGNFTSANAGTNIGVTANDILSVVPALAGNFVLIQPTGLTGTITPALLQVINQIAANKTYDGTSNATLSGGILSGVIPADASAVALSQSGNFATANAGANIAVNASDSLSGTAASNYTLVQPTGLTATITPAVLQVTNQIAANKIYDGTTNATLSGGVLSGLIAADAGSVSLTQAGSFATSTVGNNIPVTASDSISGIDAANYTLVQPTGLSASIIAVTTTVNPTAASISPPVTTAIQNYIVGIDTTTTSLLTGGQSSSSGSGNSTTSNTGTNNEPAKKLYCN